MPNFDKTGPAGQGAATGRGLGSCSENQQGGLRRRRRCCDNSGYKERFSQNNESISLDDQERNLKKRLEEVRVAKKQFNSNNNA